MKSLTDWTPDVVIAVALMTMAVCADGQATQDAGPAPPTPALKEHLAVAEVPFRRVKHQRLIDVRIKDQGPFTFLVDTGVAGAAVDLEVAIRLGILDYVDNNIVFRKAPPEGG